MEISVCKIQELQTTLFMLFAVVFYILGFNLRPKDSPPDLASVLYLSYIVLHLQKLRFETFEAICYLWLLPVNFLILYILSQLGMFMMWYPFWHMVEMIIIWIFHTEPAMQLFVTAPNLYYSLRNNIAYVIQVSSVIFITFPALKEYYFPRELTYKEIADITARYNYKRKVTGNAKQRRRRAQHLKTEN